MKRTLATLGLILAAIDRSAADECDTFNLMQFHPAELEKCIEHMKMDRQIMEMEISTLNIQLCTVALKLDHLEPGDDLASLYCPKKSPASKRKPAPPAH